MVKKNLKYKFIKERIEKVKDKINWNRLSQDLNIPFDIIKEYKKYPWNWYYVSSNKNITYNDIINNPEIEWDYEGISQNYSITIEDVYNNLDKQWDWFYLSKRMNFKDIFDKKYSSCLHLWDYAALSINPTLIFKNVLDNLDQDLKPDIRGISGQHPRSGWNWYYITRNKNITFKNIKSYSYLNWDWPELSRRIKFQDIKDNPHLPWSYNEISYNKTITDNDIINNNKHIVWNWNVLNYNNITLKIVKLNKNWRVEIQGISALHPHGEWDWYRLSKDLNITYQDVLDNYELKWDINGLALNIHITFENIMDFLKRNPNNVIPINELIKSKKLPFEVILKNLDKNINWELLSEITSFDNVINNIELPWSFYYLSRNRLIKYKDVIENIDLNLKAKIQGISTQYLHSGWNWDELSEFIIWNEEDFKTYAINKIKKQWLKSYYEPKYKLCQNMMKIKQQDKNAINI